MTDGVLTLRSLEQAFASALVRTEWKSSGPDALCSRLSTDSRDAAEGVVFVAVKGERFDGHAFVESAARKQAIAAVVEHKVDAPVTQFIVKDARLAYGLAAKAWRARFPALQLAAVGGSNGKTTTTQMLAAIARAQFGAEAMLATEGNFNNDIGVPRMLLRLKPEHRAAVIEAGMNHPGEMAHLADWIRPTTVLLTNAQREHQEFLSSVQETAHENGLLIAALADGGSAVFPADDPCAPIWASLALARGVRAVTYASQKPTPGFSPDVVGRVLDDGRLSIEGLGASLVFPMQIAGEHNVHNAVGAAAAALAQGFSVRAVEEGLSHFKALPGRGARWHSPKYGLTLIDDAYNANPDSVLASMKMLSQSGLPADRQCFILGDMAEVGSDAAQRHAEVGAAAKALGIGRLWCAGPLSSHAAAAFGPEALSFADRDALIAALPTILEPLLTDEPSLAAVKASHSMGLERVVAAVKAIASDADAS